MDKNRVQTRIYGRTYTLVGEQPEEQLYRISKYVDNKVTELTSRYPTMSTTDVGILVALNIAGELLSKQDEESKLDDQIAKIIRDTTAAAKDTMLPKLPQISK